MSKTRKIELNGKTFEVDERHLQVVDDYRIGSKVRVLSKKYANNYTSYPGIIVGFEAFQSAPCAVVAYLKTEYNNTSLAFLRFHENMDDYDICPAFETDIGYKKADVLRHMESAIKQKEQELADAKYQKQMFLQEFDKHFTETPADSVVM